MPDLVEDELAVGPRQRREPRSWASTSATRCTRRRRDAATPIMASRVTSAASSLLAEILGARRALGQHEVAQLRARVPDAQIDRRIELEPELAEHRARLGDDARR